MAPGDTWLWPVVLLGKLAFCGSSPNLLTNGRASQTPTLWIQQQTRWQSAAVSRSAFLPAPKHSYVINIEWSCRWFKCANWAKHHFSWGSRNCAQRYTKPEKESVTERHNCPQLVAIGNQSRIDGLFVEALVRCKSLACWLHDTHWVCFFWSKSSFKFLWKSHSSFFIHNGDL